MSNTIFFGLQEAAALKMHPNIGKKFLRKKSHSSTTTHSPYVPHILVIRIVYFNHSSDFCLYGNDIQVKSRKAPAVASKQSMFQLMARLQEGL